MLFDPTSKRRTMHIWSVSAASFKLMFFDALGWRAFKKRFQQRKPNSSFFLQHLNLIDWEASDFWERFFAIGEHILKTGLTYVPKNDFDG